MLFRTLRHALYPLSYRCFHLAGFEPATSSFTAKYQISSPPLGKADAGEQSRTEWRANLAQGASTCMDAPEARVTTSLARTPPRYAEGFRLEPQIVERSWGEGTVLFTTDKWFPGEQTTRPFGVLQTKESASSPPGSSIISSVSSFSGSGRGWKQKPLRSVGSEGFDQVELWKSVSSSGPREKARACYRTGLPTRWYPASR